MTSSIRSGDPRTDILIIVPKLDELYWIGAAFGCEFEAPDRHLPYQSAPVYERSLTDDSGNVLSIAFVSMEDRQGNTESSLVTQAAVGLLDPALAVLAGTALGNAKRCGIGDVVFSEQIAVVSEPKALESGQYSWRPRHIEPTGRMRRDIGRYRQAASIDSLQEQFRQEFSTSLGETKPKRIPKAIHFEAIASGDILIASREVAQQLWSHDDRLAGYEMEAGGFSRAVGSGNRSEVSSDESQDGLSPQHQLDWFVIRGVSDFGDANSKRGTRTRQVASAAVGIVLQQFLTNGLRECHPFQLRPPTEVAAEIPRDHFYVAKSGTSYFRQRIEADLGVTLPPDQPTRNRTIGALAALLYPLIDSPREEIVSYLTRVRGDYFTEKYVGYTYKDDLRSLLPAWAFEFREIVHGELNLPRSGLDVIDVGVGNGLELPDLFGEAGVIAGKVTGVDVSHEMVGAASEEFPGLVPMVASAEDLTRIDSRSVDLYVSLRTYMSRLFDIPRALEEAVRVLRPSGGIVLSIADGYVVEDDGGQRRLVRGLTVSGGDAIDPEEPHFLASQLRRHLWDFGFEMVGYRSGATDVYVWGRSPRAHARLGGNIGVPLSEGITAAKRATRPPQRSGLTEEP